MYPKSLLFIGAIFLVSCKQRQSPPAYTWLDLEKLNGNIKQITETQFNIIKDTVITDFDELGNVVNVKEIYDEHSREYLYTNIFDQNNNKVKTIITHKNWGVMSDTSVNEYDKGLRISNYNNNTTWHDLWIFKYDSNGYVAEAAHYSGKHLLWLNRFTYNKYHFVMSRQTITNYGLRSTVEDTYKYLSMDDKKNWTKKAIGDIIVKRKIIYY